jgi:hypothetical protein
LPYDFGKIFLTLWPVRVLPSSAKKLENHAIGGEEIRNLFKVVIPTQFPGPLLLRRL